VSADMVQFLLKLILKQNSCYTTISIDC